MNKRDGPRWFGVAAVWGALAVALTLAWWENSWVSAVGGAWDAWTVLPGFSWLKMAAVFPRYLSGAAGLAAVLLGAYGAGRPCSALFGISAGRFGRFIFSLACGFGVVSLFHHGLGLAGLLFPPLIAFGCGLALLAGIVFVFREKAWRDLPVPGPGLRIPLAGTAIALACVFVLTGVPDTHDDARQYHLAAPEQYLLLHKINAEPRDFVWHMPLGMEMDFLPAFLFGDIEGAKTVALGALLVMLGAVFLLARRIAPEGGREKAGLWAVFWAATAGQILQQCWIPKNDAGAAMYLVAAAWCLVSIPVGGARWILPLAWLAGLAMSVKFTSGLVVAGLGLAAVWLVRRVKKPQEPSVRGKAGWRGWGLAIALAIIPFSGWLAESWLFLGNPFNPFLSGLFPTLFWGPGFAEALGRWTVAVSPPETYSAWDWLRGVWRVIGEPGMGSAALFALIPLSLATTRTGRIRNALVLVMAVSYILWLPSYRNSRYLLVLIPVSAALIGDASAIWEGARGGLERAWRGSRLALALYALAAFSGLAATISFPHGWLYLTGQVTRGQFMAARFTTWDSVRQWVNKNVPPNGRAVFCGEEQRLWLERRVMSFGPVFEPLAWRYAAESGNPAEMRKKFFQAGVTHLVHNFISGSYRAMSRFGGVTWTERQTTLYAEFIRRYLKPVRGVDRIDHINGGFMVYELALRPAGRPYPLYFLPFTEGKFRGVVDKWEWGMPDEAFREWDEVTAGARDELGAGVERGRIFLALGKWAEAAKCLQPGVGAGLVTDLNLEDYGICLVNLKKQDEGVRWMCEARRVFNRPSVMDRVGIAFFSRGRSRYYGGDYGKAARDAEQSVYLWPNDAKPRILLAASLVKLGRGREALKFARDGVRMAPGNRDGLDTLKEAESLASRGH